MTINVLFVCTGNICRSPMAEAVFAQLVHDAGLTGRIDCASAGTSTYHVGESTHPGTLRVLRNHGIEYHHTSRRVTRDDFRHYHYLIAMDDDHLATLLSLAHGLKHDVTIARLLDFADDSDTAEVPDPYYTGGFEQVYGLVLDGCRGLLDHIRGKHALNGAQ